MFYQVKLSAAFCLLVALLLSTAAEAETFRMPHRGNHPYIVTLIEAALEEADGEHSLSLFEPAEPMPQARLLRRLDETTARYNLAFTGYSTEREKLCNQIDIPLTRGLMGARLFIVRADPTFSLVSNFNIRTNIPGNRIGSGQSWPDTDILEAAGFDLEKSSHDNLWHMLARSRIDALHLSLYEVNSIFREYKGQALGVKMAIDRSVILQYPMDFFLYTSRDRSDLAAILKQGFDRMYKNGKFMEIFNKDPNIRWALGILEDQEARIVKLANPFTSERFKAIPKAYWHTFENSNEVAALN